MEESANPTLVDQILDLLENTNIEGMDSNNRLCPASEYGLLDTSNARSLANILDEEHNTLEHVFSFRMLCSLIGFLEIYLLVL
jgi:hypothetical protein